MDEENDVNLDTPNEDVLEPIEIQEEAEATDGQDADPEAEALRTTNKRLFERAKKAEAELKALRASNPTKPQAQSQLGVEEAVLLANGMHEELLAELKAVAQVRGISLIKAQSDPIFVAVRDRHEKDQKRKDASLPASRGSGGVKAQKAVDTPGISREEHMRLAREMSANL